MFDKELVHEILSQSHHYFDLNSEVVFTICRERIPNLVKIIMKMMDDM